MRSKHALPLAAVTGPIDENTRLPLHFVDPNGRFSIQETIITVANILIDNILLIAGFLAVLFLLFAGIKYITSAGHPERAKEARAGIINVIIGVIVIVATYYIVRLAISLGTTLTNP